MTKKAFFNFSSNINEPLFIVHNEVVEFANSSAIEFFHLENKNWLGENISNLLSSFFNDSLAYINIFRNKLNSSKDVESFEISDLSLINKSEKLNVTITKIPEECSIIHFKTNELIIKNLKKNYEREKLVLLEKIKKAQNVANEMKAVFLNQVSHEIRTPLNAILSFASLIKEELKDYIQPDMETGFEVIKRGGDRVIRTVDLMLNMSEIITNTFTFKPQEINLFEDVVYSIFEKYKNSAKEKNLNFTYEIHCNNLNVCVDEFMINQIIDNLVNNAIKFTNSGEVKILFTSDNANKLVLAVKDTGIGISEEYIKRLYQPFSQEVEGVLRSYDGNGLGLSLAKKYCEINKIDLRVESLKNVGTTFYLEFDNFREDSNLYINERLAK